MHEPIASVGEFYAHALAIEHEAAERYREFATHFADRGEEVLAGLCGNLARLEQQHYEQLVLGCEGITLPVIPEGAYRWPDGTSPESPARELLLRVAQPRQLLEIALDAELRARGFFVWVGRMSPSAEVKRLAADMAAEETEHVRWVLQAIEYHPSQPQWEALLEDGIGPGVTTAN